ncbi:MAG: trypsin-like peptidase domain-containing protein, partial [Kineosporiaceae bacterium]
LGSPAPNARRRGFGAMVAAATSLALMAGVLGGVSGYWLMDRGDADRTVGASPPGAPGVSAPSVSLPPITRPVGSVAEIAARVLPSVVQIEIKGAAGEGTGSGFVIDDKGHILTNNHVVSATTDPTITVVLDDGTHKPATVVGTDVSYDLAVLKADIGPRAALTLGDSDQVVVGDLVIAIGAPLGLQGTVTTGIVSAKNRPVRAGDGTGDTTSYLNAIQTDAAINPGNSGGPLVDARGQVIGVNSAIASSSALGGGAGSGNIGLGFAIPSNQAKRTADALIAKGVAEHPVIGVQLDERYTGEGVKVSGQVIGGQAVTPGGPADKAGIKPGDIVIAIDGRPVTSPVELVVAVRAKAVGETVQLTVRRGGRTLTLAVTLAAAPSS